MLHSARRSPLRPAHLIILFGLSQLSVCAPEEVWSQQKQYTVTKTLRRRGSGQTTRLQSDNECERIMTMDERIMTMDILLDQTPSRSHQVQQVPNVLLKHEGISSLQLTGQANQAKH